MTANVLSQTREIIQQHLLQLRWGLLQSELEQQYDDPRFEKMAFETRLEILLSKVCLKRNANRLERLIQESHLPTEFCHADFEEYWDTAARMRHQPLIQELKTCHWIAREKPGNLIIVGPTGSGKSWLAGAFVHEAIKMGFKASYWTTHLIMSNFHRLQEESKFQSQLSRWNKHRLIVLDDFLLQKLTEDDCVRLFDFLLQREKKAATIFISQYPFELWGTRMATCPASNSILDRLRNGAYYIDLMESESLRKRDVLIESS